jgi:hypothetical protein
MKPSELPAEMRRKLESRAKARTDYKTRLCQNYEKEGVCEYLEICHFAHGQEELKKHQVTRIERATSVSR